MSEMITLYCEAGKHEWERPKQKGQRPKNCPTHKAELDAAKAERRELTGESRLQRAMRKVEADQRFYQFLTDEEVRQVEYIDQVITTGLGATYTNNFVVPREEADLNILEERREMIFKQVRKRGNAT